MRIGFVGCGAIGSCYASYLSRKHEVCVLDTYAPVIESIKKNGILLDECAPGSGTGETVSFRPAMATTDPKEIGVVDLLIVFVHYQYLEAAVRNALPMIDRHTMILCLQNGLGNYDEIAKVVPEEQIIIGNTAFGATPMEPGHVKHTGTGVTNMGSLKAPKENVERMAEALREAGLEVCVHENVMNAIWHKLLANVAINGMSALLETKNGFVDGNQYAHEAARMLAGRALDIDAAGREPVFLGLADGHLALGEVFFDVAVGRFFRDRADGSGAEHVVRSEHLDAVGVGSCLILAGEVEVDIGDLVAAEAEEGFKRDVEAVFI